MTEILNEKKPVVINEDFSFISENGKTWTLKLKQKLFAEAFLEFGGCGVTAIIKAGYDVNYKDKNGKDTGIPNRRLASTMAWENLQKPHISAYINSKLEEYGFSDDNVKKQHLFLLNQQADLKSKARAIDMYYKIKGEYPIRSGNHTNYNTVNVFSLADLAHKSTLRRNMGLPPVTEENPQGYLDKEEDKEKNNNGE